jgi:hypothetical protein
MTPAKPQRDELSMTILVTLVLLAMSLFAPPAASADPLPPARTQGQVQYIAGGIGKDESDAMKQANADYPLLIEFASTRRAQADGSGKGEFVSGADVAIRNAGGDEILHTQVDGPLLLVRVPPGEYSVDANWQGMHKQSRVNVTAAGHKHVVMAW